MPSGKTDEPPKLETRPMQDTELLNGGEKPRADRSASMTLAITMHYKEKEKTRELPLTPDTIGRIALEAEFRDLGIAELIARLIAAAIEKDMIDVVLG